MSENVDDVPVGISEEEPPHTPRFIRQFMNDLEPTGHDVGESLVHVIDLEGCDGVDNGGLVPFYETELCAVARTERDNPPVVHQYVETQYLAISLRRGTEVGDGEDRHGPQEVHGHYRIDQVALRAPSRMRFLNRYPMPAYRARRLRW